MGLTIHAAKMLRQSKSDGANFTKVCQVGRQALVIHPEDRPTVGIENPDVPIENGDYQWPWADSFFRDTLGVQDFHTMDYSDYEGADLLHDLNSPLAPEHYGRFDAIVDGGTLEHIFNVPEALKSYMRLVKVGGRIFIFTPANGKPVEVGRFSGVAVYVPNPVRQAQIPLRPPAGVVLRNGALRLTYSEQASAGGKLLADAQLLLP